MSGIHWRRRGACPSLAQPMPTGDGLLARLNPAWGALTAGQLAGIAQAALEHGNGLIEITSRASLQIRGLTETTAPRFNEAIAALGIALRQGLPVETGPLAGLDATALTDPTPLVQDLHQRLADSGLDGKLGPKVSIAIDDGGALPPGDSHADIRLEAQAGSTILWRVRANGAQTEGITADNAVRITLMLLNKVAGKGITARARDLTKQELADCGLTSCADGTTPSRISAPAVGLFLLHDSSFARSARFVYGVALPFGQIHAGTLLALAATLDTTTPLRLAASGLLAVGLTPSQAQQWLAAAKEQGFIIAPDDPRLAIHTCAGAPACASAHLDTKGLANALSHRPAVVESHLRLHLFGCEKQCARPTTPALLLTGSAEGCTVSTTGQPLSDNLQTTLQDLASQYRTTSSA